MKKILVSLFVLSLFFTSGIALADTTDTFAITITCSFLSLNLRNYDDSGDYGTWAIGSKNTNVAATMVSTEGIMVVNTANVISKLSAWVSTQAANWTNGGSAGADVYVLELKPFDSSQATPDLSSGTATIETTSDPGNDFKTGLAAITNQWVYAKFTTPTSTSTGAQQTITTTIKVTAE